MFLTTNASTTLPDTLDVVITGKDESDVAVVFTVAIDDSTASLAPSNYEFIQTEALTTAGIAVQKYGAYIIPASQSATDIGVVVNVGGTLYSNPNIDIASNNNVGDSLTLYKGGVEPNVGD